jgi:hypothetical protein
MDATGTPDLWEAERREVRRHIGRGEYYQAFDRVRLLRQSDPQAAADPLVAYLGVLALVRGGAIEHARRLFAEWGLDARTDEDTLSLRARLLKERALRLSDARRRPALTQAAGAYFQVYQLTRGYFPAINAATLSAAAGNLDQARRIASQIEQILDGSERPDMGAEERFWRLATLIETKIHLGKFQDLPALVEQGLALDLGDQAFAMKTTVARSVMIASDAHGLDRSWLTPFLPPRVVHYAGHMIDRPQAPERFPASAEPQIAAAIAAEIARAPISYAYGSVAAGADILFAEACLAAGVETHLVLPCSTEDFMAASVAPCGEAWVSRARALLARSRQPDGGVVCHYATEEALLDEPDLFAFGSRVAMGLAMVRARTMITSAEQLLVWDGKPSANGVGTAADQQAWAATGRPQHVIACGARADPVAAPAQSAKVTPPEAALGRQPRAILFGDFKGFSQIRDSHIQTFVSVVLGSVAPVIDAHADGLLLRNTWGDGLYLVFETPEAAARCALALVDAMNEMNWSLYGFPADMALRLGGHFGPVYEGRDPVTGALNFFGAQVTRAARVEPVTLPGSAWITEQFAAALAIDHGDEFNAEYVGELSLAKGYPAQKLFNLTRL